MRRCARQRACTGFGFHLLPPGITYSFSAAVVYSFVRGELTRHLYFLLRTLTRLLSTRAPFCAVCKPPLTILPASARFWQHLPPPPLFVVLVLQIPILTATFDMMVRYFLHYDASRHAFDVGIPSRPHHMLYLPSPFAFPDAMFHGIQLTPSACLVVVTCYSDLLQTPPNRQRGFVRCAFNGRAERAAHLTTLTFHYFNPWHQRPFVLPARFLPYIKTPLRADPLFGVPSLCRKTQQPTTPGSPLTSICGFVVGSFFVVVPSSAGSLVRSVDSGE